jgi:YVTN family beta-propeller protein
MPRAVLRWLGFVLLLPLMACQPVVRTPQVLATVPLRDVGNPAGAVVNPRTGYVYVSCQNSRVAVLQKDALVASLPVGDQTVSSLAVDQATGLVYAVSGYDDSVTIIRDTEVITTVATLGRRPEGVAVEPISGLTYVVSGYRKGAVPGPATVVEGIATVISGTQVLGAVPLGPGPYLAAAVVADPVHGYVYVAAGDWVVVIKGMEVVARHDLTALVIALDVDPRTGDVYALYAAPSGRNLSQFREGRLVSSIAVERPGGTVRNLRVHPRTGDVYVVDFVLHEVIQVRDMQVVSRIPVQRRGLLKMAIDPLTGNVYVANFDDDSVSVIHGSQLLTTVPVGWYPYGIAVNPTNGWVYVANTNDRSVTVLGYR